LLVASKELCIVLKAERTKYMFMSYKDNAGQNHNIEVTNPSKI